MRSACSASCSIAVSLLLVGWPSPGWSQTDTPQQTGTPPGDKPSTDKPAAKPATDKPQESQQTTAPPSPGPWAEIQLDEIGRPKRPHRGLFETQPLGDAVKAPEPLKPPAWPPPDAGSGFQPSPGVMPHIDFNGVWQAGPLVPQTGAAGENQSGNARNRVVYDAELFPWHVPGQINITTVKPPTDPAPGTPIIPSDHIVVVDDFAREVKPSDDFKAAVNVTDSGFISGFTLIEGGCDFLDDGVPFSGDRCATNTPPTDPNWSWPNVMVQVLDHDGFRFTENQKPLARDEARIEKVHIFGGGGPELLGRGGSDVIEDFAPATYDERVQYELITVRVEIRSIVRNGFNLLRDWLLRRPQAIALAARSERLPFEEQSRSAPSKSTTAKSKARSALSLLLTSTGTSTGEAFRVQALANSPITFDLTSVVAEPLKGVKPNAIAKASTLFGARGAETVMATGYCLEFTRQPPSAGMLYRIAGPEIQKRFEPLRRIANAARRLSEAGQLRPDSDPKAFVHSISQWAIWTGEQKFTQSTFTQAFIEHTKKAVEAAGRPWQREYAQVVEQAASGRWQQIQRILQAAGM